MTRRRHVCPLLSCSNPLDDPPSSSWALQEKPDFKRGHILGQLHVQPAWNLNFSGDLALFHLVSGKEVSSFKGIHWSKKPWQFVAPLTPLPCSHCLSPVCNVSVRSDTGATANRAFERIAKRHPVRRDRCASLHGEEM